MNIHVKNERDGVLSILLFVHEEGGFLDEGIDRILSAREWTDQQRRLMTRLSKGTVEYQIGIDELIDQTASLPVRKMKPAVRDILRMSVYSLFFLDQIPERAVVNEAVELAKLRAPKGLSGFVNGVLRRIVREKEKGLQLPAVLVPQWIKELWTADYGAEKTEQILADLQDDSDRVLTARVNRTRTTRDELIRQWRHEGITCDTFPGAIGVTFTADRSIREMPGYEEGLFYIQDSGSMTAGELAPVKKDDQVLDLCAAPGGKATQLAERAGYVLACDLHENKLPVMRENAERLGLSNIDFLTADATGFNPDWESRWDVVLADVPCSGLGVIGHKPDIKLRLKKEDIGELVRLQRAILKNAVRYVKPGGYLVYSTCTVCRDENDRQVDRLLEKHAQWHLLEKQQLFPGSNSDGFFMALLQKD